MTFGWQLICRFHYISSHSLRLIILKAKEEKIYQIEQHNSLNNRLFYKENVRMYYYLVKSVNESIYC